MLARGFAVLVHLPPPPSTLPSLIQRFGALEGEEWVDLPVEVLCAVLFGGSTVLGGLRPVFKLPPPSKNYLRKKNPVEAIATISRNQLLKARCLQCGFWPRDSQTSDLNFAVDFGVDVFSSCFFQRKRPKNPPSNPPHGEGWREEILPMPRTQASFLHRFFIPRGHNSGDLFGCILDPASRQPLF